jgi:hypothetical protein
MSISTDVSRPHRRGVLTVTLGLILGEQDQSRSSVLADESPPSGGETATNAHARRHDLHCERPCGLRAITASCPRREPSAD